MSLRNKNIFKLVLSFIFVMISYTMFALPVLIISEEGVDVYYNTYEIMNLFYGDLGEAFAATGALFVVILNNVLLISIIANTISILVNSNSQFNKLVSSFRKVIGIALVSFYGIYLVGLLLTYSMVNYPNTVYGVIPLFLFVVISLIVYLVISKTIKVEEVVEKTETCPKCGAKHLVGSKYCPDCGYSLVAPEAGVCPNCGAHLKENDLYCTRCGKRVK